MSNTAAIDLHDREGLVAVFEGFRDELDDHNDRRERLIKVRTAEPSFHVPLTKSV